MKRLLLALTLLVCGLQVHADERIRRYDIDIAIEPTGALNVTERITANVEGNNIRRGIYRDFPTRYRDRYGNRVVVDLQVLGVERNGTPEPWFTEQRSNGVRINTGNDDFLPAPAEHTFTIRYRTTRQLGFFADHDELYWNAIGTGWMFPIDAGTVEVRLPTAVPTEQLSAEGYTGPQGAKGQNYRTELPEDGVARWHVQEPLNPYEGLTIVLSFPKGVVAPPVKAQRLAWFLKDNGGVLVALVGLALLLGFCIYEWRRVGRDPRKGIIIARYEPPDGQTPATLRYLHRMGYDMRCFTADLLQLAVGGNLHINRDEKRLRKDEWRLERVASGSDPVNPAQNRLLAELFDGKATELVLRKSNATTLQSALGYHAQALGKAMKPRYFRLNGWSIAKAIAIAVLAGLIALMVSQGAGIPAIMVLMALSVVAVVVFICLIRAPTMEGRKLLDEIEGLKLYLSVAERDELARITGPGTAEPQLDAKRYEQLLPYAVALEVEEAWTQRFTAAVGVAAAAATASSIGWYHGGNVGDLGSLSKAIGSSLSSQIASASTPPGSSSGSSSGGGGGGFSGGGGGGGGGGGR